MQLLDLFAGLLWLSSVIFLLFVLDVIITRYRIVIIDNDSGVGHRDGVGG
ncbi:hypothetical protein MJ579_11530 [Klebsiella pneumoniae]|nr:hypothetical protein MJ579_11530 [Klebsiella pneumoniae]